MESSSTGVKDYQDNIQEFPENDSTGKFHRRCSPGRSWSSSSPLRRRVARGPALPAREPHTSRYGDLDASAETSVAAARPARAHLHRGASAADSNKASVTSSVHTIVEGAISCEFGFLNTVTDGSHVPRNSRVSGGEGELSRSPEEPGEGTSSITSQALKSMRTDLAWWMGIRSAMSRQIVENRVFTGFFTILTFYALFASDLDLLYGNPESEVAVSITMTVAMFVFLLEMVLQCFAKANYLCRWPFLLDVIAWVSIIPDTHLFKMLMTMGEGDSFVAARTSRMAKFFRVFTRSTKTFRLQRLVRIVRVVGLIPRLASSFRRRDRVGEAERLLEKKLYRVFKILDDDVDGYITQDLLDLCLSRLRGELTKTRHAGLHSSFISGKLPMRSSTTTTMTSGKSIGVKHVSTEKTVTTLTTERSIAPSTPVGDHDPEELIPFEKFTEVLLSDDQIHEQLLMACREQLKKTNNMGNLATKHAEDVGMKVAVGVLLMLLVINLLEPDVNDQSVTQGLQHLNLEVETRFSDMPYNASIPQCLREHVQIWAREEEEDPLQVVYLDLDKHIYCNELDPAGQRCDSPDNVDLFWQERVTVRDIKLTNEFRNVDLEVIMYPDADNIVDVAELDEVVQSMAIINIRDSVEENAAVVIFTTLVVIVIILLGITLITWDLAYLKGSLLRPLQAVADEMQSIVQLQIAALNTDPSTYDKGTAEIRLIQKIFENMKKAIRSWGKYVPWPVVQLLLQAGVDATHGVREKEVTLFFSDIASFTSIVEGIPPEESMRLLSRYFNDMSKVIDDHGGIVIEFIGDAILSIYGEPLKNPDHAPACVRGTLQMFKALNKMNTWAENRDPPLPKVNIRCGIHTGTVLVGNMGFQQRMKYGVVGENANIPSHLEELNKRYGTNNLVSEATFSRLDPDEFVTRPIDFIYLRNTEPPQSELVYQVLSVEGPGSRSTRRRRKNFRPAAELHAEAMKLYREREFHQALTKFGEVDQMMRELQGVESDVPSHIMQLRCEVYARNPPDSDWDGVWNRAEPPQ